MKHPEYENSTVIEELEAERNISRRTVVFGIAGLGALTPVLATAGLLHDDHDDDHDNDRDDDDDHDRDDRGHDHDNDRDDDHDNDRGDDDDHDRDDRGHDHDNDRDDDDDHDRDDDDDDGDRAQPTVLEDGSLEVRITDDDEDAFVPRMIAIEPGQTITFANRDDKDHTATGADWDTGILAPGESGSVTFDGAGEFAYACQIHPEMTGTVMVTGDLASPEASPDASSAAAGDAVRIFNLAYDPAELAVSVGTTVTWTNDDQLSHTVTSVDGAFDSGTIAGGETASITFDEAGTFEYVCAFHPGMRGTIVVS